MRTWGRQQLTLEQSPTVYARLYGFDGRQASRLRTDSNGSFRVRWEEQEGLRLEGRTVSIRPGWEAQDSVGEAIIIEEWDAQMPCELVEHFEARMLGSDCLLVYVSGESVRVWVRRFFTGESDRAERMARED